MPQTTVKHPNYTDRKDIVCTEVYTPVCGKVNLQCITEPCEIVEKTFSNRCFLDAHENAVYLRDGEC